MTEPVYTMPTIAHPLHSKPRTVEPMQAEPLTDACCEALRNAGAHRVVSVLRAVADRGVDLKVAFGVMPDHERTLYVETCCYPRGLMTREEREALIGAVGCTGDWQRSWDAPAIRLSLYEHCGCGRHPRYSRLVLHWEVE